MQDTLAGSFTKPNLPSGTTGVSNRTGSFKARVLLSQVKVPEEISTLLLRKTKLIHMTTQIRASHILVSNEDDANKILKRIKDGEDFAAVAKRFSSCPSRKNGGDLGWFGKGQMVPEFEQAAFAADQGAVIGPVKTQFGFHVIKVTSKK
jgi:peptidyl-prolyl cis-trans isomerase C